MNKGCLCFVTLVLFCLLFFSAFCQIKAEFQINSLESSLSFVGNDVDASGVLWAGDKNFVLWKSSNNGSTFTAAYNLPHESPLPYNPNPYWGIVWLVFVDSRGYIFVSAGGAKSCMYRSIDNGTSFNPVLNANDTSNRSFYVAMTEDNQGNLYAATYTIAVGLAQPLLLKSTNGGASWMKLGSFSLIHFHNVAYNPYNGYLYAVTGERSGSLYNCNDSEKIFRSKDLGASWSLVVDRNDTLGTVYLPIAFAENYVYVGQDYPNRNCQIHRFLDDGKGPFVPQVVYTPPSDGCMPFISGKFFNNNLFFANCAESQNGTSRVLSSLDGLNWSLMQASNVSATDNRWNFFTQHTRSGIIFATFKAGYSYQIKDVPLEPIETPTPTIDPTNPPATTPTWNPQPPDPTPKTKYTHISPNPTPTNPPKEAPVSEPKNVSKTQLNTPNSSLPAVTATPTASSQPAMSNLFTANAFVQVVCMVLIFCGVLAVTLYVKKSRKKITN